jgi:hypothetical protein
MYEDRANELISMVGKSRNEWKRKYEAAEAENERLRAALSTARLMAHNYAGMADDDDWGGDYLREIEEYTEAALRGEETP